MKRKYYALVVVLGLFGLYSFYPKTTTDESSNNRVLNENNVQKEEVKINQRQTASVPTNNKNKIVESKDKLATITKKEITSLQKAYPSTKQVFNDKKSNPHGPSKTLMTFAKKIAPLMEKAFTNERDANILVGELKNCAINDAVDIAARALCVQDTEKLSEYHSHLKGIATELRSSVSPEVRNILDTNDAVIKK